MKEEAQRIAMAELDDWTRIGEVDYMKGIHPKLRDALAFDGSKLADVFMEIPDYLNDLNSVGLVVSKLTDLQKRNYGDILNAIVGAFTNDYYEGYIPDKFDTYCEAITAISQASAAQKVEAVLKATRLWVNS